MKAYLLTSGTIFGVIAILHGLRSIFEWRMLATDPVSFLGMAALGVLAAVLSAWAWRLFARATRL